MFLCMSFELTCGKSYIEDSIDEIHITDSNNGLRAKILRKDGLAADYVEWDPRDTILVQKLGIKVVYPSAT